MTKQARQKWQIRASDILVAGQCGHHAIVLTEKIAADFNDNLTECSANEDQENANLVAAPDPGKSLYYL